MAHLTSFTSTLLTLSGFLTVARTLPQFPSQTQQHMPMDSGMSEDWGIEQQHIPSEYQWSDVSDFDQQRMTPKHGPWDSMVDSTSVEKSPFKDCPIYNAGDTNSENHLTPFIDLPLNGAAKLAVKPQSEVVTLNILTPGNLYKVVIGGSSSIEVFKCTDETDALCSSEEYKARGKMPPLIHSNSWNVIDISIKNGRSFNVSVSYEYIEWEKDNVKGRQHGGGPLQWAVKMDKATPLLVQYECDTSTDFDDDTSTIENSNSASQPVDVKSAGEENAQNDKLNEEKDGSEDIETDEGVSTTTIVVSVIVAVLVLIAIIFIIRVIQLRRKRRKSRSHQLQQQYSI